MIREKYLAQMKDVFVKQASGVRSRLEAEGTTIARGLKGSFVQPLLKGRFFIFIFLVPWCIFCCWRFLERLPLVYVMDFVFRFFGVGLVFGSPPPSLFFGNDFTFRTQYKLSFIYIAPLIILTLHK